MIVLYILLALLVLLLMVTIHEFGHYVAGKILGFKINEFSIGFGPSLFTHKCKSGEDFSIRIFPLGGYCAFEGEETSSEKSGAFNKQKPWKRLIVLFNGAFFNFISAILFCFIMLVSVGYDIPQVSTVTDVVQIDEVIYYEGETYEEKEFVFEKDDLIVKIGETAFDSGIKLEDLSNQIAKLSNSAGFVTIEIKRDNEIVSVRPIVSFTKRTNNGVGENYLNSGDVIIAVNGTKIDFIKDNTFNALVKDGKDSGNVVLTVIRENEQKDITLSYLNTGIKDTSGKYAKSIGVSCYAYKFSFGESLARSVPYTFGFSWKVLGALGQLVVGQASISDVGGPIYTIGTIANLSQQSWTYFLTLLPLIAANLAIFNWLPIPALDGSRMVFTTIEWIRGKPLFSQKTENLINNIGFFVLLALVFLADFYHIIIALF